MFKMNIGLDVGYYNLDEDRPPCSPLAGTSMNVDYRGRLSLCCNLSGYRGAVGEADVVADLNVEGFAPAFARLQEVAAAQLARRREALAEAAASGAENDIYLASPCLFCLRSFGKLPWHAETTARTLPVLQAV